MIRKSQWCHTMVDGAVFWISCKQPAFLSGFSHLQVIQNLVPSIIVWHQCDTQIGCEEPSEAGQFWAHKRLIKVYDCNQRVRHSQFMYIRQKFSASRENIGEWFGMRYLSSAITRLWILPAKFDIFKDEKEKQTKKLSQFHKAKYLLELRLLV